MINDFLAYSFLQNAFWASVFTSISCAIIGTYIVSRRYVFISGGITHSSFGGVGIGYFLGINPMLGAAIFGVFSALGIEYFSKKGKIRNDSVIAILWSLGIAIGIIFIYITPGYAPNLNSYLFGSILSVSIKEVIWLAILSLVLILFFALFYHIILFVAFDEDYAKTHHIPVSLFNYLLMTLTALTVVLNIRVVGIILGLSLLTIPQNTANIFFNDFKKIIYASALTGLLGSVSGLIASYYMNIPSGASIIFSLVIIFLLAKVIHFFSIQLSLKNNNLNSNKK